MTENESHEPISICKDLPNYKDLANCKDFLAQVGPIDSLLGSVSYNEIDNVDGKTQQLRTSARVFKKMKFDLTNNASMEKKEKKEEVKVEEPKPEVKKPANPLWSLEEKDLFFEALNEYGKDFESIHGHICKMLKKKGVPDDQLKNKHQVRHFYYKTFHMLISGMKFNEQIPKNVQELYTLINYGEMRRKMGSMSKKTLTKLQLLVANGCLHFRYKGKTIKLKTPMCRALRRVNQLDEKFDDLKLPTRVLVDLRPKDMVSFLRIQTIAQNPRIRVSLSLQRRLSSLISCINTRWKDSEAVVYDKAVISTNPITKDCVPDKKTIAESSSLLTPSLRLAPPREAHVELPSIDISEYFTGQSISLTAFERRKGVKPPEEVKKEEPEVKTEKSPTKHMSDESISCDGERCTVSVNKEIDEAVSTILSLQSQEIQNKCDIKCDGKTTNSITQEEKQKRIEEIRKGWTVDSCGSLTIGEIYLMYGSDSKLVLEYSWEPREPKQEEFVKPENDLTNSLQKLLSIAKLHYEKPVMKCPCGHVCGSTTKSNAQFKKPLTTRVVKKAQPVQENPEKVETVAAATAPPVKVEEPHQEEDFLDKTSPVVQIINQRDNFERLNPRIRGKVRGRFRNLVVERKLVPNKSETKHQIVSMNIVPQENLPPEEPPKASENALETSGLPSLLLADSRVEDSCISNKSFSALLEENPSSNMSSGISKILKENENQWITSDVADYSLSSLLGHLDAPAKAADETQMSELAPDMDAQLRTLLIETSVDYTATFADLAADLAAQVNDNKQINDQ